MALITRVSRLFRADLHAVLDRIEEPDVLLRQAVREMEEELSHDQKRVKLLQHEHAQLNDRKAELEQSLGELDGELDVCFDSGNDGLARTLVRRKLETQRFLKALERKGKTLKENLGDLQARVEQNVSRLNAMRQKVELLEEQDSHESIEESWVPPEMAVREEDVEVALLCEKQKRKPS